MKSGLAFIIHRSIEDENKGKAPMFVAGVKTSYINWVNPTAWATLKSYFESEGEAACFVRFFTGEVSPVILGLCRLDMVQTEERRKTTETYLRMRRTICAEMERVLDLSGRPRRYVVKIPLPPPVSFPIQLPQKRPRIDTHLVRDLIVSRLIGPTLSDRKRLPLGQGRIASISVLAGGDVSPMVQTPEAPFPEAPFPEAPFPSTQNVVVEVVRDFNLYLDFSDEDEMVIDIDDVLPPTDDFYCKCPPSPTL